MLPNPPARWAKWSVNHTLKKEWVIIQWEARKDLKTEMTSCTKWEYTTQHKVHYDWREMESRHVKCGKASTKTWEASCQDTSARHDTHTHTHQRLTCHHHRGPSSLSVSHRQSPSPWSISFEGAATGWAPGRIPTHRAAAGRRRWMINQKSQESRLLCHEGNSKMCERGQGETWTRQRPSSRADKQGWPKRKDKQKMSADVCCWLQHSPEEFTELLCQQTCKSQ